MAGIAGTEPIARLAVLADAAQSLTVEKRSHA